MSLFSRNWLTGHESWPVRLWRIRFGHAVVVCLPFWFILLWYVALPIFDHIAYNQALGVSKPLDAETFHLHLYDQLQRDARRFGVAPAGRDTSLPRLEILLSNEQLDKLDRGGPPGEGKARYAQGFVRKGARLHKARLRYRGYKHWNWNYAQKSWKVRLDDELLMGQQIFSFINPANPVPFMEQIVLEIARKNGLIAPDYFPFRLQLNGSDMGVYWFMGQPDEFLLRRNDRIPGAIYSGNRSGKVLPSGASDLFMRPQAWKKPASRHEGEKDRRDELKILLDAIGDETGFAEFARMHLDLSKFALLEALDIVFGCSQHNWDQDHKLYFDPYRGRWEPIAWDFRRFEHKNVANLATNPLQLRLRELPEYVRLRHHWITSLLEKDASPHAIALRAEQFHARLAPEFESDAYWDAYNLLPSISTYYRQWVRPLNARLARLALDSTLATLRRRAEMLRALNEPDVRAVLHPGESGMDTLHVLVGAETPVRLQRMDLVFDSPCPSPPTMTPDIDGDGRANEKELSWSGIRAYPDEMLLPGYRAVAIRPVTESRGPVRLVPEPRRYAYLIAHDASCRLLRVKLHLTRESGPDGDLEALPGEISKPAGTRGPGECSTDAPPATPGRRTPHPWCLRREPRNVQLGPGEILVEKTLAFPPETAVVILPGTRFRMSPGTSMFFFGPVTARGTAGATIEWIAADDTKPWGGIVVQGEHTRGSAFSHVRLSGGSFPQHPVSEYPAMFNVHDTQDITLINAVFSDSDERSDTVHAAYVNRFVMEDCRVENASSDAVDAEFVTGRLIRLFVRRSSDECVDSMGSRLDIEDARIVSCGGNAISAGERSRLHIRRTAIVRSNTGLLAKNHSEIHCDAVVLYRNDTGVRIEKKEIRYEGASRVVGRDLYILETRRTFAGPQKRFTWTGSDLNIDAPDVSRILPLFPGSRTPEELQKNLERLGDAP